MEDAKPQNLGTHVARLVDCQATEDRLEWCLELLWPLGPACEEKWTWTTGRTWQPHYTNKLMSLLAAFGVEDARSARSTSPQQLYGKEFCVTFAVVQHPETGELVRVVLTVGKFEPSRWGAYLERKQEPARRR